MSTCCSSPGTSHLLGWVIVCHCKWTEVSYWNHQLHKYMSAAPSHGVWVFLQHISWQLWDSEVFFWVSWMFCCHSNCSLGRCRWSAGFAMCLSSVIPKLIQTYWNLMLHALFQSVWLPCLSCVGKTVQLLAEESEFKHKIRTVSSLLEKYTSLHWCVEGPFGPKFSCSE